MSVIIEKINHWTDNTLRYCFEKITTDPTLGLDKLKKIPFNRRCFIQNRYKSPSIFGKKTLSGLGQELASSNSHVFPLRNRW